MATLKIRGKAKLSGRTTIHGSKNAALPILAATLLTREECVLHNVPRITDVLHMVKILESLGAKVRWRGDHELSVQCDEVDAGTLDTHLVKSMRASVLLLGPMLARFGAVTITEPGGCIIGNRPLDAHFLALKELGASVERSNGWYKTQAAALTGAHIILPEFSVTATENTLMAAVNAHGTTTIELAAAEPHVTDLVEFLKQMGAAIDGEGTHTLTVRGGGALHGATHTIIPDQIEIGTFAVAAAATHGDLTLSAVAPAHLSSIIELLRRIGVRISIDDTTLTVSASGSLASFKLQALPHPGFPTDLQAPFGVLATQCTGTSLIHDPLYEGRMGYVAELIKMGANAVVCDPHRVLISGPTPLYGQEIKSLDLRAGATLVIAGLIAEGETVIREPEVLDRGYEGLAEKLQALGAEIEYIK